MIDDGYKKFKGYQFYPALKCPHCGYTNDGFGVKDELMHCPRCEKSFDDSQKELAIIGAFMCECNTIVPPVPSHRTNDGYQCQNCKRTIPI